jgi:hypothetical protein
MSAAAAQHQEVRSMIGGHVALTGTHAVSVGATRVIAIAARTPLVTEFRNGTIVITAGNPLVSTNLRSTDRGWLWQQQALYMGYVNTRELSSGTLLVLDYNLQLLTAQTGTYRVNRWTSTDRALTLQGPFNNGRVTLPPSQFPTTSIHWINELIEVPGGPLLAVIQSTQGPSTNGPWRTVLIESTDGGINWAFKSLVADQSTIFDPNGELTAQGWLLYGAVEPTLIHAGGSRLVCVMRTVNDESALPTTMIGPPREKYHDLSSEVPGSGIYPGIMSLNPNAWYPPGPISAPLIIATSDDLGATWSPATPMARARGVFPRLTSDGAGTLALTYGGLSGVPRWGHAIVFSTDGGATWTREVEFGPVLTTGYTEAVGIGPRRFVCFFDCTPPQPWTQHERWWLGAVDIELLAEIPGTPRPLPTAN